MLGLQKVSFYYSKYQPIFTELNLQFEEGKFYAILGESGCGKTTLLSLMGGLDEPTSGRILYNGVDISSSGLEHYRKEIASFIFQSYNLIEYMNASENVALTAKENPLKSLNRVGIKDNESKRNVLKLSGGQQQRVAVARALASQKPIILGDEPTGNLDENNAMEMVELLKKSAHEENRCVIVVTHSMEVAKEADVIFEYCDHSFCEKKIKKESSDLTREFELTDWKEEEEHQYSRNILVHNKVVGNIRICVEEEDIQTRQILEEKGFELEKLFKKILGS